MVSRPQGVSAHESASTNNGDFDETMRKAKLGDKEAQFALGDMFQHAIGIIQDFKVAMDWYLKAADQGYTNAQNAIGFMHRHGRGVPQDFVTT
ncbi:hypothetical protein BGW39_003354, partial [Mortierella sp. 14UC]